MKKYIKETFDYIRDDFHAYGKGLVWAIVLIIAHIVILSKYLVSLCPLVWITGYPCPACGLTRAGICVFRGEFGAAFELHPFIYVIIVFVLAVAVYRYLYHGKSVRWMQILMVLLVVAMVVYYIYRLINYFPNHQPMVYEPKNLTNLVRALFYRSL